MSKPALLAILRAAATDFDVDEFLARPGMPLAEEVWHRGEVGPLDRARETSGFNLAVADVEVSEIVFKDIHVRLSKLSPMLKTLRAQHVELTLDIAITAVLASSSPGRCVRCNEHLVFCLWRLRT